MTSMTCCSWRTWRGEFPVGCHGSCNDRTPNACRSSWNPYTARAGGWFQSRKGLHESSWVVRIIILVLGRDGHLDIGKTCEHLWNSQAVLHDELWWAIRKLEIWWCTSRKLDADAVPAPNPDNGLRTIPETCLFPCPYPRWNIMNFMQPTVFCFYFVSTCVS